jgi:hypothetical protein
MMRATKSVLAKGSSASLQRASAGTHASLTVYLRDASGKKLTGDQMESATVKVYDLAECQACPQVMRWTPQSGTNLEFKFALSSGGPIRVEAEASDSAGEWQFMEAVALVNCDEASTISMRGQLAKAVQELKREVSVAIGTRWSEGKGGRLDRMPAPEIEWATAERISGKFLTPAVTIRHAKIHGGIATFNLKEGVGYKIDFQLKEKYVRFSPAAPFYLKATANDQEIPIWCQPGERVAAFFFVDSSGQAACPPDVHLNGARLAISSEGLCTLTGAEVGEAALSSKSFHLTPDKIYIDDRMVQAHVIHAAQKAVADTSPTEAGLEEIILDFTEVLAEDEQAVVRVLTLERKLLKVLAAESGKSMVYRAQLDQPLILEAMINGTVIDRKMHIPAPTGRAATGSK